MLYVGNTTSALNRLAAVYLRFSCSVIRLSTVFEIGFTVHWDDKTRTVSAAKMADVVCAQNFFRRRERS
jgi:hypothetical protein